MFLLINYLLRVWRERRARATSSPSAGRSGGSETRSSAASWGPLALLAHQVRYDLLTSLRSPRARFFTFFFPLVLLIVFNGVFGKGTTTLDGVEVPLSRFYLTGILAVSIVVATYANLVISISTLRETGVLKRRRSAPVPAALLIAGQALSTLVTVAIMTTLLLVIGKVLYGVGIAAPAIAAIVCVTIVGALTFASIGYAVSGLIGSPEAAQPIVQATMMPLWFISGVFIPTAKISGALHTVGTLFPVEHLAYGLQVASVHASFAGAISTTDLLVLLAWGVAAAGFAAWRYSWMPSTATA
jgi:ABC-2 type transport system permease protein